MKRALITFTAVLALSISVVGASATVSDARSDQGNCSERGGTNNRNHDKPECEKNKCDNDDRGKRSTPKACDDDGHGDGHGHGHGGGEDR